jgi:catechol 2,3-dioxygenase-like lactoylglutathione lyase family enzyme
MSPHPPPHATGHVTGFFHVGLTVGDMDEALRFYRDALGLELESLGERPGDAVAPVIGVEPERIIVAWLRVPGSDSRVEIFEYQGIERFSAAARPCDIGYGHFCLHVDDLDAVYQRLRDAGYHSRREPFTVTSGPHLGAKAVYATSPDGYNVELYQAPPPA